MFVEQPLALPGSANNKESAINPNLTNGPYSCVCSGIHLNSWSENRELIGRIIFHLLHI